MAAGRLYATLLAAALLPCALAPSPQQMWDAAHGVAAHAEPVFTGHVAPFVSSGQRQAQPSMANFPAHYTADAFAQPAAGYPHAGYGHGYGYGGDYYPTAPSPAGDNDAYPDIRWSPEPSYFDSNVRPLPSSPRPFPDYGSPRRSPSPPPAYPEHVRVLDSARRSPSPIAFSPEHYDAIDRLYRLPLTPRHVEDHGEVAATSSGPHAQQASPPPASPDRAAGQSLSTLHLSRPLTTVGPDPQLRSHMNAFIASLDADGIFSLGAARQLEVMSSKRHDGRTYVKVLASEAQTDLVIAAIRERFRTSLGSSAAVEDQLLLIRPRPMRWTSTEAKTYYQDHKAVLDFDDAMQWAHRAEKWSFFFDAGAYRIEVVGPHWAAGEHDLLFYKVIAIPKRAGIARIGGGRGRGSEAPVIFFGLIQGPMPLLSLQKLARPARIRVV
ncbi:uncharacterized protein PFL1_02634 [Pseudozyma flocculosa PF-1]|uniref:Uncharacterized protein n=2 Tax=Pseudozyma flocculosa TaxID=84751 RepID=A0A5C3F0Q5_9BASI|nr:uncharacterized protein PFL1_02634 [Pseudozyma flocculosa PF-1]EPQ29962.1 hypothetical protein PFL1_02634 [Pseudozyma flocculosa PF-1]SPO37277.1 uncharacterized protein PSFLO_02749 [Pseudozyma flocculosa]